MKPLVINCSSLCKRLHRLQGRQGPKNQRAAPAKKAKK